MTVCKHQSPGVNAVGNQNTTGSAATLTTARTIAGQSFDGSANITIALSDLSNVHTTAPSSNQVLTWDATNSRWAPADASGGTLPTASDSTLGGIKVGTNLSIDSNGVLFSNRYEYDLHSRKRRIDGE